MWKMKCAKVNFFDKIDANTLLNEEPFGFFGSFEIPRWAY